MDIADILRLSSDHHDQQGIDLLGLMMQMDHDHYYTFDDPSPPLDHFSGTAPPSIYNYDPQYSSSSPPAFINPVFTTMPSEKSAAASMREMIFRVAAMQPVQVGPEAVKPAKKRRNVRISKDPQSVAARQRRERISERIRILQRLVPGGTRMDTASMLDEAAHYVKFLKKQLSTFKQAGAPGGGFPAAGVNLFKGSCQPPTYYSDSYVNVGAMLHQQMLSS